MIKDFQTKQGRLSKPKKQTDRFGQFCIVLSCSYLIYFLSQVIYWSLK